VVGGIEIQKGLKMKKLALIMALIFLANINIYAQAEEFNKKLKQQPFMLFYTYNPSLDLDIDTEIFDVEISNYNLTFVLNGVVIGVSYIPVKMDLKMADYDIDYNMSSYYLKFNGGYNIPITDKLFMPVTIGIYMKDEGMPEMNFSLGFLVFLEPLVLGLNYDRFTGIGIMIGLGFIPTENDRVGWRKIK